MSLHKSEVSTTCLVGCMCVCMCDLNHSLQLSIQARVLVNTLALSMYGRAGGGSEGVGVEPWFSCNADTMRLKSGQNLVSLIFL